MKYFIEFVVSSLVKYADEVDVEETVRDDGSTAYLIRLNPSDIGRVIGKRGKTIGAIRDLLHAAAARDGKKIHLDIMDEPPAAA